MWIYQKKKVCLFKIRLNIAEMHIQQFQLLRKDPNGFAIKSGIDKRPDSSSIGAAG